MQRVEFTIEATDGRARFGALATPRGAIRTPAFMPVGTAATDLRGFLTDLRTDL